MCFQGFSHHKCGHIQLFERACELAYDQPFYIKVMCPNYRTTSCSPNCHCGIGKFYCKENEDGVFLDKVHHSLQHATNQLNNLKPRIKKVLAQQAVFTKAADENGVSAERRKQHPAYDRLRTTYEQLRQQEGLADQYQRRAMSTIQEAIKFYALPRGAVPHSAHPFIDKIRDTRVISAQTINVSNLAKTEQFRNIDDESEHGTCTSKKIFAGPYPSGSQFQLCNIASQQIGTAGFSNQGPLIRYTGRKVGTSGEANAQKFGKSKSPDRKSNSPRKDASRSENSNVRRSARVRDKKVSYAESDLSSHASREVSPEKSDVSGFSPSKSDVTTSPAKSEIKVRITSRDTKRQSSELHDDKPRINTGSLGNLIGDWQERVKRAAPPNMGLHPGWQSSIDSTAPQSIDYATVTDRLSIRSDIPHQYQTDAPQIHSNSYMSPLPRPPTRHGPPQNQHLSAQNGHIPTFQPPAVPNFLPNQPLQDAQQNLYNMYRQVTSAVGPATNYYGHSDTANRKPTVPTQVNRNWLINTPAFSPSFSTGRNAGLHGQMNGYIPMQRTDSVIGDLPKEQVYSKAYDTPVDFNYNRMRRSFSAASELTPPAAIETASVGTDPRKRRLPASSPVPPSKKRMRLSLPGEDNQTVVVSSPSKMPSQATPVSVQDGQEHALPFTDGGVPTPAPILAPTAIMYVPYHQATLSHEESEDEEPELPGQINIDQAVEDEFGHQSSDIDWGDLINEDIL